MLKKLLKKIIKKVEVNIMEKKKNKDSMDYVSKFLPNSEGGKLLILQ